MRRNADALTAAQPHIVLTGSAEAVLPVRRTCIFGRESIALGIGADSPAVGNALLTLIYYILTISYPLLQKSITDKYPINCCRKKG